MNRSPNKWKPEHNTSLDLIHNSVRKTSDKRELWESQYGNLEYFEVVVRSFNVVYIYCQNKLRRNYAISHQVNPLLPQDLTIHVIHNYYCWPSKWIRLRMKFCMPLQTAERKKKKRKHWTCSALFWRHFSGRKKLNPHIRE